MSKIDLICGDCLEIMGTLRRESVDLALTDPPYNVGTFLNVEMDDYEDLMLEFMEKVYNLLKPHRKLIFTFSQKYMFWLYDLIKKTNYVFVQTLCHFPRNIASCTSNPLYRTHWQPIFILSKFKPEKLVRIKSISTIDVLEYPTPQSNFRKDKRLFVTQKPLELFERLILENSKEKGLVLDPFIGSGTTAIACLKTNRHCIGIDNNPDAIKLAEERIERLNSAE